MPSLQGLTERNRQLYFLFQTVIVAHRPESLAGMTDADVAEAATAAAATLETAARGVIYEHLPQSVPAQRLSAALRAAIDGARQQGATIYDGEAVLVLRAIARGVEDTQRTVGPGSPAAYLELMRRILDVAAPEHGSPAERPSSIIVP